MFELLVVFLMFNDWWFGFGHETSFERSRLFCLRLERNSGHAAM